MKKIILFILVAIIIIGCETQQRGNIELLTALSIELDSLKSELGKYKERYGELPIINEANKQFGIWKTQFYVDNFGEPTKSAYVTNANLIRGTFSNTATQNSALTVRFLIDSEDEVDFELYEYARNNPVKDSGTYKVFVRDKDGNDYELEANNRSDRLSLSTFKYRGKTINDTSEKSHANVMYDILIKGGNIKFNIKHSRYSTSVYNFQIDNADYLQEALESIKK